MTLTHPTPPAGRRSRSGGGAVLAAPPAMAAPKGQPPQRDISRDRIRRWANDTWRSLVAMTDEGTGLTADNIEGSLTNPRRSGYTSPTNIGGYLWSALVARDLRIISRAGVQHPVGPDAEHAGHDGPERRERHVLQLVRRADRGRADHLAGRRQPGQPVPVQRGQRLAGRGLIVVQNADPSVARHGASSLLEPMDFAALLQPHPAARPGGRPDARRLLGGRPPAGAVEGNYLGVGRTSTTPDFHYDTTVSETRIASYIAIARAAGAPGPLLRHLADLPADCGWSWQEQRPVGETRRYLGIDVFEGAYTYRGMRIVPGWGGSMFEALMPNMFVPEERWAPRSWGVNHPADGPRAPRARARGGRLRVLGVLAGQRPGRRRLPGVRRGRFGLNPEGYFSDVEGTNVRRRVTAGAAAAGDEPEPRLRRRRGHAARAVPGHAPRADAAYRNLVKLERELPSYAAGGFYDAVAVGSGWSPSATCRWTRRW